MRPFVGVSAYPANAWNRATIKNYFKCFPAKAKFPATSVLWGPWGQPVSFIEEFIDWAGNRNHLVQIHISAETARRTNRNGHQIAFYLSVADYNKALINKDTVVLGLVSKRVENIVKKVAPKVKPKTTIWLSVGLEDNLKKEAAKVIVHTAKKTLQNLAWKIVRNPECRTEKINEDLVEGHGRTFHCGTQDVWNFDGIHVGAHPNLDDIGYAVTLETIKKANREYKGVFLWSAKAQGWTHSGCQYEGRTYDIDEIEYTGFSNIIREVQK